ncbi:NADH:flavin oxidoreductase/NADH oxidase [Botrytis cinerea]
MMGSSSTKVINAGAENVSYFTPAQNPPSGTAVDPSLKAQIIPKLFQPLNMRGVTFQNRIWVNTMAYVPNWWLGHAWSWPYYDGGNCCFKERADRSNGVGLWNEEQLESLKAIVDFTHSQSQHIGIQLVHAGRKASTVAAWLGNENATKETGGWPDDIIGPSPVPWDENSFMPKEMTLSDIADFRNSWVSSVERALRAGFDVIEIHAAHGFLLHQFLSPVSNKRTDEYGGSFENRIRLLLEVIQDTRPNGLLEEGLDAIFSGRLFQKNPGLVWSWADDLRIVVHAARQIQWGFREIPNPFTA